MHNYTMTGKTDGLGCQLNAVYSAIAFCEHSPDYNYVHTPFYSVSHGWGWETNEEESSWKKRTNKLEEFIGIPNGRSSSVKIHTSGSYGNKEVFNDCRPSNWYDDKTLKKIRDYYWSTAKPAPCQQDIVVHIRRGDNQPTNRQTRTQKTYTGNEWYRDRIPWIASMYPEDFTIAIHSEGEMAEFESIMDGWTRDLKDKVTWKLGKHWEYDGEFDLVTAFHDMVTAKVLLQARSGFSYTAGMLNENEVWFYSGNQSKGQKYPLDHWRVIQHSSKKDSDGLTYKEIINLIKREKIHGTH